LRAPHLAGLLGIVGELVALGIGGVRLLAGQLGDKLIEVLLRERGRRHAGRQVELARVLLDVLNQLLARRIVGRRRLAVPTAPLVLDRVLGRRLGAGAGLIATDGDFAVVSLALASVELTAGRGAANPGVGGLIRGSRLKRHTYPPIEPGKRWPGLL